MTFKDNSFTVLFIMLSFNIALSQNTMRPLSELTSDKSGGQVLNDLIKTAKNNVVMLPADPKRAEDALYQTQVTTHSIMGAVVYFTGGLLIDNGWVRLLGSGSKKLSRSLPEWNKGKTFKKFGDRPSYLLIADDVIGGFFAVNGDALGTDMGMVYYLAPETLKWEALHKGYSDFVDFCLNGDLNKFYQQFRWKQWQTEVKQLNGDKVYSFYPFLWSKEGKDIAKTSKKIVPIQEQYDLTLSFIKQLN
jgi:hypothetical protein